VAHITHRCHKKEFLLKFAPDRRSYLRWLFESRKRFGLYVLDYVVTSNHIHLLVKDTGEDVIARSMQLIAGQTAQQYNRRKQRKGAFWEDRCHATAIETDAHLYRCLVYIDLNMVRARVVQNPSEWEHGGHCEIQRPPERYAVIDLASLSTLCGFLDIGQLQQAHRHWVAGALTDAAPRDQRWSEAVAVGSKAFVENVQQKLGIKARYREVEETAQLHSLRERMGNYSDSKKGLLSPQNTFLWAQTSDAADR
jgi:putative transposase